MIAVKGQIQLCVNVRIRVLMWVCGGMTFGAEHLIISLGFHAWWQLLTVNLYVTFGFSKSVYMMSNFMLKVSDENNLSSIDKFVHEDIFSLKFELHTHTHSLYEPRFMCVSLIHSMSGLCPLGKPCVARFCSNRFWQLCNFCWFIPDLGNSSSAVQVSFVRHMHTNCLYIAAHLHNGAKRSLHTPRVFIHTQTDPCISTGSH